MATAVNPNASQSGSQGTGAIVNYFKPPAPVAPAPAPTLPMAPLPIKPIAPVLILPGPVAAAAPSGCSGGSCPLMNQPAGQTVTIAGPGAPVLREPAAAASADWLTKLYAGLPLWVWVLVALVVLLILRSR